MLGGGVMGLIDAGPRARVRRGLSVGLAAVMPRPTVRSGLAALLGSPLSDPRIATIAEQAHKSTRPQGSVHGDAAWRRHMARIFVRRGLEALRDGLPVVALEGEAAAG